MGKIRKLLSMPYVPLALAATALWFSGSTYWYVCETEDLCSSNEAVTAVAETSENANELDAAIADTQESRDEALITAQDPGEELDTAIAESQDERDEVLEVAEEPEATEEVVVEAEPQEAEEAESAEFDSEKKVTALFNADQATFATIGWQEEVTEMVEYLRENPDARAEVLGYAARAVSATDEEQLSRDRAEALKSHMVERGVSAEQIEVVVKAYEDPIADNLTEEGRAQNRRAVVCIK